jgi:hypothetical protein
MKRLTARVALHFVFTGCWHLILCRLNIGVLYFNTKPQEALLAGKFGVIPHTAGIIRVSLGSYTVRDS